MVTVQDWESVTFMAASTKTRLGQSREGTGVMLFCPWDVIEDKQDAIGWDSDEKHLIGCHRKQRIAISCPDV